MKQINMYIRASVYNRSGTYSIDDNLEGQYIVILEYKGVSKELYNLKRGADITTNRMLLIGFIDAIKSLKESCMINLYTHAHVGIGKLKSKKGNKIDGVRNSVNKDLLLILKTELNKGRHEVVEKVGQTRQSELAARLKKYKEEQISTQLSPYSHL